MLHAVHERRARAHEEAERGMFTAGMLELSCRAVHWMRLRAPCRLRCTAGEREAKHARELAVKAFIDWTAIPSSLCRRHQRGGGADEARPGAAPPRHPQVRPLLLVRLPQAAAGISGLV